VDAGELGAGHHATALYEVRLADGVAPGTPIGAATVKWAGVTDGQAHESAAALVAADPEAEQTHALALASTVADLAEFLKHVPDGYRGPELSALRQRASALGADELVTMIDQAERAKLYKN
jgi:Ca-activated chloride channel homolog